MPCVIEEEDEPLQTCTQSEEPCLPMYQYLNGDKYLPGGNWMMRLGRLILMKKMKWTMDKYARVTKKKRHFLIRGKHNSKAP